MVSWALLTPKLTTDLSELLRHFRIAMGSRPLKLTAVGSEASAMLAAAHPRQARGSFTDVTTTTRKVSCGAVGTRAEADSSALGELPTALEIVDHAVR